jgi:hypothetical protein
MSNAQNPGQAQLRRAKLTRMTDTPRIVITYKGEPACASALVQMLEQEGVQVDWTPPTERRSARDALGWLTVSDDINAVLVSLVCNGTKPAIKAGVDKFRKRFPRAKVEVEDGPDDGGFFTDEEPSDDDKEPSA